MEKGVEQMKQVTQDREFSSCTQMRRKLVTHGTLNFSTGSFDKGPQEWVTEACNSPLFGDNRKIGKCKACQIGWKHEHNYPV